MTYIALCLALFLPLFFGAVLWWVDVLERFFERWHESDEWDGVR